MRVSWRSMRDKCLCTHLNEGFAVERRQVRCQADADMLLLGICRGQVARNLYSLVALVDPGRPDSLECANPL